MASRFPIVIEAESAGLFSAYVPGLPVYAQGPTLPKAALAIRRTLAAYLKAHPDAQTVAEVRDPSAPPDEDA